MVGVDSPTSHILKLSPSIKGSKMKACSMCRKEKPRSEFHVDRSKKTGMTSRCKTCSKEYVDRYYRDNRYRLIKASKDRYTQNADKVSEANKKRYLEEDESTRAARKRARKAVYWENREENIRKSSDYHLSRMKEDPFYRFKARCRKRVWAAFNENGYSKKTKTFDLIGCSQEFLLRYMEGKFSEGMSWDNYGEWHVDHIVPFSAASNQDEVQALCHYLNLQPLWADENVSKSAAYCPEHKKKKLDDIRRSIENASS